MKAVVFERFGDPAEVLQVRELPTPEPGPGQVRVRMRAAPINPSDLLYMRGEYGRRPKLPATPGFEGAGLVEAAGPGLLGRLRAGRRVAVLHGEGGRAVVKAVGRGGRMLVYGTLAGEPLSVDPRILLTGCKSIEGFWLSEWVKDQGVVTMLALFRRIKRLLMQGVLNTEVGNTFPLDDIKSAVQAAAAPGRHGKILLRM